MTEREILMPYFDKVCDKTHWKNPIKAYCRDEEKEIINRAIIFFTGTEATFVSLGDGWSKVSAIGYQAGPCGDK